MTISCPTGAPAINIIVTTVKSVVYIQMYKVFTKKMKKHVHSKNLNETEI